MGTARPTRRDRDDATRLLDDAGPTISITDTAKVLGISRGTAYDLARRDELGVQVIRLGRSLRVSTASLRQLVNADGEPAA